MKNKFLIISAVLIAAAVFGTCESKNTGDFPEKENIDGDVSYALGMNMGVNIREGMLADGIIPDFNEFLNGIRDGFGGRETRFEIEEAMDMIDIALNALNEKRNAVLIQEEIEFLAQNAKKPGVKITSSGLQYEVINEPNSSGPKPSIFDIVQVHYEGRLADGYLFGSTYEYGEPVGFPVNDVFPGWSEGMQLMTVGSKYKFYIPSELAFGSTGTGPIPPYSTLVFTVELLEIL